MVTIIVTTCSASLRVFYSFEVISGNISEFILWSQLDDDNYDEGSDSVLLIMIHSNHLQVRSHLGNNDRESARIASAEAKKYAQIAIYVGTAFFVLSIVFSVVAPSLS